jgi:hypothetical protein
MKYFFIKLMPPRPDFMVTMTDSERLLMRDHAVYWQGLAEKGWAVAYGPVAAETGSFGAGFWALPDDVDPKPLADADPTLQSKLGFQYEIHPMPALILSKVMPN